MSSLASTLARVLNECNNADLSLYLGPGDETGILTASNLL